MPIPSPVWAHLPAPVQVKPVPLDVTSLGHWGHRCRRLQKTVVKTTFYRDLLLHPVSHQTLQLIIAENGLIFSLFLTDRMGKAQSKDSSAKVPDETDHARPKKQLVEVEEVFVQKIAYKCGVTEEELSAKKEVFRHVTSCNCTHVQSITGFCSGSTPAAPRPSASTSSRTCTGTSAAARRTSSSTSTSSRYSGQEIFCRERHFINILVRAFDTNKDDLLTFREWQVGFYLLLLLPSVKFFFELLIISFLSFPQEKHTDVSKEDFLLALEVSQTSLTKTF